MKNGKRGASVWENNREDTEDSATQVNWLLQIQLLNVRLCHF